MQNSSTIDIDIHLELITIDVFLKELEHKRYDKGTFLKQVDNTFS